MKMKALVKTKAAPGAEIRELEVPSIGPTDLLVRVKATAICGTDLHIYNWSPWAAARIKPPMIFGHEFCGEVVRVGSQVTAFQVGDLVAADSHVPCGHCYQCQTGNQHICDTMAILGVHRDGCFAEYISLPQASAWKLSPDTSPDLGAILEPFGVAVHGVASDAVEGRNVAIFGCGPIGLMAVGTVRALGAFKIFVSEVNQFRLEMAHRLAPEAVLLNPTHTDVVAAIRAATKGQGVEVSLEYSGSIQATKQAFQVLKKGGRITLIGLPSAPIVLDASEDIIYKEAKVLGITGRLMWNTWYLMEGLMASGKMDPTVVITHRLPMSDFAPAMELLTAGKASKVILYPGG